MAELLGRRDRLHVGGIALLLSSMSILIICCSITGALSIPDHHHHRAATTSTTSRTTSNLRSCHAFLGSIHHCNYCARGGSSSNSYSSSRNDQEPLKDNNKVHPQRHEIKVSTSLELPFNAEIAFDAFSDLPRQAEFSPWLQKVEYLVPPPSLRSATTATTTAIDGRTIKDMNQRLNLGETKWYMGFRGLSFTWNAISTRIERPSLIEWESTSGMKNFGRVEFQSQGKDSTVMTLTMTFVAPRLVAALFSRSSKLANFVQNRMLRATLMNFRDIMMIEKDNIADGQ